jgi:hypothetical protein
MKRICILLTAFLASSFCLLAQNEIDIYRAANTFNEGTARFDAMAGSFGALGAESGCARINPAGLARYTNSSFGFTLNGIATSNSANFQNQLTTTSDFYSRLSNLNFVVVTDKSLNRQGFLFSQFGFGINRIANFNSVFSYKGQQFESLLDEFASNGYGTQPVDLNSYFPFSTSLAYETYAIDFNNPSYIPRLTSGDMIHNRTVTTSGGISEYYFNFSGNYINKLYIGGNLGIQRLKYDENIDHSESLIDTIGVSLRSFNYNYHFNTKGNGLNLKIGIIYLPQDNIRLGFSIHTPTSFNLLDQTNANMTAMHNDGIRTVDPSLVPKSTYKYNLSTPARFIGSFGYVFEKRGCINIDAEFLDYSWGKLKPTNDPTYETYSFSNENAAAKERLKAGFNLKIGSEIVFSNKFFLRGGFASYFKGDKALLVYGKNADQLISGGVGYRYGAMTLDFAVKSFLQTKVYQAFTGSSALLDLKTTTFVIGFNYKFPTN